MNLLNLPVNLSGNYVKNLVNQAGWSSLLSSTWKTQQRIILLSVSHIYMPILYSPGSGWWSYLSLSVQDWSLQCPSNAIWTFKIYLSKQPFKTQLQIENEDVIWSSQNNLPITRTNKHMALSLQEVELDGWFLIPHIVLEICIMYHSCTSLMWVLYFISIILDWRLGFEPTLQLKGWNLRALQNETCMRASILNIAFGVWTLNCYVLCIYIYIEREGIVKLTTHDQLLCEVSIRLWLVIQVDPTY